MDTEGDGLFYLFIGNSKVVFSAVIDKIMKSFLERLERYKLRKMY